MDKIQKIILLSLVLTLSACAMVPLGEPFTTLEKPAEDEALVYIYRPYNQALSAYGIYVNVDEVTRTILPPDAYSLLRLKPGARNFRIRWPGGAGIKDLHGGFDFKAGKIYFLRYSTSMSFSGTTTTWRYSLEPVTHLVALPELKCCRFSKTLNDDATTAVASSEIQETTDNSDESTQASDLLQINGRYRSVITSNSIYAFRGSYRSVELQLRQYGNSLRVVQSSPKLDIDIVREGNRLRFTTGANDGCGCSYTDGYWQISDNGNTLKGNWSIAGGNKGSWTLTKID
ncbi:MAG: DUF2846 domain-containing protein [Pseudomonadota bacterium]